MNELRSAIYVLWLAATVVVWALLVVLVSIFVRGHRLYWFTMVWLRMAIWGARVICGVRHRIQGWENLPDSKIILCPKHQSTWETFAFPTLMPHPLCYVFKRELLLIPFFGWAIGRLDMIHIDRSRRTEAWAKVASQGRRFMAQGNWVIMFPEGTRTRRGADAAYKAGAARLAVVTDTPIVPIAVTSGRCWPRRSFLLHPGVIDVSIGPPIKPHGRDPETLTREVQTWIEAEMHRLDADAYH